MIRNEVEKKITRDLCIDWSVRSHVNDVSYETLEVNPSGELVGCEEPTSNSWHTGRAVLYHTFGNSCNCDWCEAWKQNEDKCQTEFNNKTDFIKACIDNNDSGADVEITIFKNLKEIEYGFFEDEKEED